MPLTALRDGTAEMMIFQGPLIFSPSTNLRHLFVDLDDGDIHGAEHASPTRVDRWIRANVHVPSRPDWVFVKLHTHGASEANQRVLLGQAMLEFHRSLARRAEA